MQDIVRHFKTGLRWMWHGIVLLLTAGIIFSATQAVLAQPLAHATATLLWFAAH